MIPPFNQSGQLRAKFQITGEHVKNVEASPVTGHHRSGVYTEILLASRIINMDDSTANNWQAKSHIRLLNQGEVTKRDSLVTLRRKQIQVFGHLYSLDSAVGAKLAIDILEMAVNRICGNDQLVPDFPAGETGRHQPKNLQLPVA